MLWGEGSFEGKPSIGLMPLGSFCIHYHQMSRSIDMERQTVDIHSIPYAMYDSQVRKRKTKVQITLPTPKWAQTNSKIWSASVNNTAILNERPFASPNSSYTIPKQSAAQRYKRMKRVSMRSEKQNTLLLQLPLSKRQYS